MLYLPQLPLYGFQLLDFPLSLWCFFFSICYDKFHHKETNQFRGWCTNTYISCPGSPLICWGNANCLKKKKYRAAGMLLFPNTSSMPTNFSFWFYTEIWCSGKSVLWGPRLIRVELWMEIHFHDKQLAQILHKSGVFTDNSTHLLKVRVSVWVINAYLKSNPWKCSPQTEEQPIEISTPL